MTRFDPEHLVVLDEFGINLAMTRLYARAPVGERAHGSVPGSPGVNVTLLFGLRSSGPVASFLLKGAIDTPAMVTYATEVLGPVLSPDDIVLMDNVSPHRMAEVRKAIRAFGARVRYLPPYSPDLSPIESCGSKVKTQLRAAAARTYDALLEAARKALDAVTPEDAAHYFTHCGYKFKHTRARARGPPSCTKPGWGAL